MTYLDLINQLEEDKKQLEEEIVKNDEETEFFNNFSNKKIKTDKMFNINENLIIALITANTNIDFKIVKKAIEGNMGIFEEFHYKILYSLLDSIAASIDAVGYNDTINYIYNGEKIKNKKLSKRKKFLIRAFGEITPNTRNFIDLYKDKENFDDVNKCIAAILATYSMNEDIESINYTTEKFKNYLSKKTVNKASKQILNKLKVEEKYNYIIDFYENIKNYSYNKVKEEEAKKRNQRKLLETYKSIIKFLKENENTDFILTIPKEITKLEEDKKVNILKIIYCKNKNYYDKLSTKYQKLISNSINNYILTYKTYGIDIDENEINMDKTIEEVEEILSILNSLNFKERDIIINIVNNVNLDNLKYINKLVTSGTISSEFIITNSTILLDKYNNFVDNINLIKEKGFSNTSIKSIEDILIIDNEKFHKNIEILEDYELFNQKQIIENFNILNNNNLIEKIDILLESGYEDLLCSNLSLLDIDYTKLKRLVALKQLNIYIEDFNILHKLLNNKFAIEDYKLDDYIYVHSIYNNEDIEDISKDLFIEKINEFNNSKRTYNFDGIIISKNKITRHLNNIKSDILSSKDQISTIISESYIDDGEYHKITSILTNKNNQMKKTIVI